MYIFSVNNITMKLSEWAKRNGFAYQTAWNMFKAGRLPVKATQLATGTILVEEEEVSSEKVCKFCPNCGVKL